MLALQILVLSLFHALAASIPFPLSSLAEKLTLAQFTSRNSQAIQLFAAFATSPDNTTAVGDCLKTTYRGRYGIVPYCLIQEGVEASTFAFEDHIFELNRNAAASSMYDENSWGKLLNSSGRAAWNGDPSPPWDPSFNGNKSANSYWSIDRDTRVVSEWMVDPPAANATKDSVFYICGYSGYERTIQELYSPKMYESYSKRGMTWSCNKAVLTAVPIDDLN